ncbi:unnamed protein product [Closterium sp. NIES-54]
MVTTTTPGGQRVTICTCTRTGRHLAMFTRQLGLSLYTLAVEPLQVAASAQVSASGQVATSCLYRLLSHQTLLWHHCLGHPSLPRLRGMHSCLLVSGLPKSLPPLPPSPAPPCLPCIEGRQRAAPHSSSFPPTTAPLQTLHMDVWGPACVSGQSRERYFLPVADDNTQYTTHFGQNLPVLRVHSYRVGEFSSNLLRDLCRGEGILQSFKLPNSPQQNGIAERRISLVMEVTCTSMIHAAAPHFLWPFAVRYAVHQLNLWPRVSLLETSPTLCWTREVGDALVFRVWGSRAFVHVTSADKLSPRALPCDVMFDESVPFYRLFPYRSAPPPPPPLFLAPGPPPVAVGSGVARGAVSGSAASGGAGPGGPESEGAASGGAEPGGVETRVAKPGGAEPGGAEPEGVDPGGAASKGAESGGAEPQGAASSGATGAGGARAARAGGAGVATGAGVTGGDPTESGATGAGGSSAGDTRARGAGVGDTGAGGARARGAGAIAPSGAVRPLPYLPASPLLAPSPYTVQSGGLTECLEPASRPASPVRTAPCAPPPCPPPVPGTHTMTLRPSSVPLRVPMLAPPASSLPEVPDPDSDHARAASPTISCLLATVVTDPSFESAALSALVAELLDFAAASRLDYATALVAASTSASPPSVGGECALCTDVLEDRQEEFEYLAAAVPRFASMLLAPEGDPDAPDIPTPRSYAESLRQRVYGLRQASREWHDTLRTTLAALGYALATADPSLFLRTNTSLPPFYVLVYVDDLVFVTADTKALTLVKSELQKRHTCTDLGELRSYLGLQITRDSLRRTITLTQSHMVHQVLQRFSFQFSSPQPTPLSTSHSLSAPPSHEFVEPSGPCSELVGCLMYVMTCTQPDLAYPLSLLARYMAPGRHRKLHWDAAKRVLRYLCSMSGMGLVLGGRGPVVHTGHADASWVDDSATQQSSQGYTFSLGSGSDSWRSTRSSLVLSSNCEAEIYVGAMAAQELRWLIYLLTDLGEQPRSPPVLYVDNKAMIALCQEHRLEHRTKHIALRYFLALEF